MLTLCINTAGHLNTLALIKDGAVLGEENWESKRNETETLLPKLEDLLKDSGVAIEEVKALNVIQGIGGFTSLRVGISVANTIAYVQDIPMYATSVFELWSKRVALQQTQHDTVAVLIDAGRQECFYLGASSCKPQAASDFVAPQIIENAALSALKEEMWIGEINETQKRIIPDCDTRLIKSLQTPGEAFAAIDLRQRENFKRLEPWYGREPNISKSKKQLFG